MAKLKRPAKTPKALGYHFPPEWAPHRGTWLSWPRPEGISFPDRYHTILPNLAEIVRQIGKRERVEINVPNGNWERLVQVVLREHRVPLDAVHFHRIKTNECWCRDHGPAFVLKPGRGKQRAAVVDWGFNAWGGKYPPWGDDDVVPTQVAAERELPVFEPGIVMEGGSVDFNGKGTVLTTTSCLLNPNRNPGLGQKQIERFLCDYYGQSHVVWLGQGIVGDDTDGHIDDLARFLDPRTVAIGLEDDPQDDNYHLLQDNLQMLEAARDQDGRPFRIVKLPMPGRVEIEGQRVPATYLNFYFVNGALLVPTYGHKKNDRRALEILQANLPKREVVGVDCRALIWGLGSIHCLTQQEPRF
ncbi:MAG: agmatine deiminase family protein [Deltaproteobacteria bacterium]|nr:agmatine deiminase family protein [Deltaproteobacteria bacterium]